MKGGGGGGGARGKWGCEASGPLASKAPPAATSSEFDSAAVATLHRVRLLSLTSYRNVANLLPRSGAVFVSRGGLNITRDRSIGPRAELEEGEY